MKSLSLNRNHVHTECRNYFAARNAEAVTRGAIVSQNKNLTHTSGESSQRIKKGSNPRDENRKQTGFLCQGQEIDFSAVDYRIWLVGALRLLVYFLVLKRGSSHKSEELAISALVPPIISMRSSFILSYSWRSRYYSTEQRMTFCK